MRWMTAIRFAAGVGALAPAVARAQLEIAPQVGVYVPGGALVQEGSRSNPSAFSEKRPEGSLLLGVKGLYWATKRLGIAATVSFSPSPAAVTDSLGTRDVSGALLAANAQALVALTAPTGMWSANVAIGPGVVSRLGAVWNYTSGRTAPALVVSAGVGMPLYDLGARKPYPPPKVVLRLDVTDYVSRAQFDHGLPTQTTARTHHDFVAAATFSFRLRR